MKKSFVAALLLAGAAAVPAHADVQSFGFAYSTTDGPGYQTFTKTFNLPTDFTGAQLTFTNYSADDSAVVQLNGVNLFGFGIFGPGQGNFFFTANGPSQPYNFAYGNGSTPISFTPAFTAGANTLTVILNNNNAGINGSNGPLTNGPTSLNLQGSLTYNTATAAVPEPAAWALMITGFGLVGGALRRRAARPAVTFA